MSGSRLVVDDVTVQLGGVEILRSVSFEVAPGESYGIIGPNGAGKTTVLNVISGVVIPSRGRVMFGAHELTSKRPHRSRTYGIGRSLQTTAHFHDLTPLELVSLSTLPNTVHGALRATGHRRRRPGGGAEAAFAALDQLGLAGVAHRRLGDLPNAVQKLVDLARSVLAGTDLLLLDEPTSGVSAQERGVIAKTLDRVREQGRTVVVIDHDPGFVTANCDRLMALNFGQVLKVASPREVMTDPVVKRSYLGEYDEEPIRSETTQPPSEGQPRLGQPGG
ncbi:MAG: ATP-binding cassette domain-containing protein [Nocardioidaceae bacterium]